MNNLKHTLKETFKPRKRRAVSGILVMIMGIVIGLAGVALVATTLFDVTDTASVIDSIEITDPTLYSKQGFVSVQVKNNGNTAIEHVHATLLVNDADTSATAATCAIGVDPLLVTTEAGATVLTTVTTVDLNPGESTTISGGLRDVGTIDNAGAIGTTGAGTALVCDGSTTADTLADRTEYVLQVNGFSDDEAISKTITIRAR